MRTFLTSLGVLIGSTSIIIMMSLSFALDKNTQIMFEQIGGLSNIRVYPSDSMWTEGGNNSGKKAVLDELSIGKISKIIGVKNIIPFMEFRNTNVEINRGKDKGWAQIYGIDFKDIEKLGFKIGEGIFPMNKNEAIAGSGIAEQFYREKRGEYNPVKVDLLKDKFELSFIQYNSENMEEDKLVKKINITGVLTPSFDMSNYYLLISKEYFIEIASLLNKNIKRSEEKIPINKYSIAEVQVGKEGDILEIQSIIKDMGFHAESNADYYNEIKKNLNSTRILFFVVGAVAFVVAAIGIANTMIMSVYERTKEIGIMKVIGASIKDIRNMFLAEAGIIGLLGGIISIVLSYGLSYLLNEVIGPSFSEGMFAGDSEYYFSYIPIWLPFIGVAFSTFVGIVSGYLPSRRATKISAIEAIRHE